MIAFQKNLFMMASNSTACRRILAGMEETITGVSSFVTVHAACRCLHFNMAVKTPQVIGGLEPRHIDMVSMRISLHLSDMLYGERLFDVAIIAGH
jgi:hypothetical protein